jgi:hypothetical protein
LQWKVYGQGNGQVYERGNGQVYERNNDEIGEMRNVSSMFHIFGSMFLISVVFDAFVLEINVF